MIFEYGRSIEGKLARMTRRDPEAGALILNTGWFDQQRLQSIQPAAKNTGQRLLIAIYGMSHADRLGSALERVSDDVAVRRIAAPAASSNWAYAAFLEDRRHHEADVVVLAFMSANLPMINSMTPLTWNHDGPIPYTAPRYVVKDGALEAVTPVVTSYEQYIETWYDEVKWAAFRRQLAQHDPHYNPLMFRRTLLDRSVLIRLCRRAYGQAWNRRFARRSLDQGGFQPQSEQIRLARKMIGEFAATARSDGRMPVLFLVNNLGYSDHLYQALRPAIERHELVCLSSHFVVSPASPGYYLPDSHFIESCDHALARELIRLIDLRAGAPQE